MREEFRLGWVSNSSLLCCLGIVLIPLQLASIQMLETDHQSRRFSSSTPLTFLPTFHFRARNSTMCVCCEPDVNFELHGQFTKDDCPSSSLTPPSLPMNFSKEATSHTITEDNSRTEKEQNKQIKASHPAQCAYTRRETPNQIRASHNNNCAGMIPQ